jgi:hypothetical protein
VGSSCSTNQATTEQSVLNQTEPGAAKRRPTKQAKCAEGQLRATDYTERDRHNQIIDEFCGGNTGLLGREKSGDGVHANGAEHLTPIPPTAAFRVLFDQIAYEGLAAEGGRTPCQYPGR